MGLATTRTVSFFILTMFCWAKLGYTQPNLPIMGWQELVMLTAPNSAETGPTLAATLDPGLKLSSLQVSDYSTNPEKRTVAFTLRDRFGTQSSFEVPLIRSTNIKLSSGKIEDRPIVALDLCILRTTIPVEISLKKDSTIGNPVRISRNDLAGKLVIDPSKSFTFKPQCQGTQTPKSISQE